MRKVLQILLLVSLISIKFSYVVYADEMSSYNYIEEGERLRQLSKYEEAIKAFDKAIALASRDSTKAVAYENKGFILENMLYKYNEALTAYEKAFELEPENTSLKENIAILLDKSGRHEEAIKEYDKLIELENDLSPYSAAFLHKQKGVALISLGKYEEAIKEFDKALEIDPEYKEIYINKKEALTFLEDKERITIEKSGVITPTDTPPMLIGGRVYVPLRVIAELTGAEVRWDDGTIIVTKGDTIIKMNIGDPKILVNNKKILMDNIPFIRYNRTMVPLRWIASSLKMNVNWDGMNKRVMLD